MQWNSTIVDSLVLMALQEDLGRGDLTSACLLTPGQNMGGRIVTRQETVACGLELAMRVFHEVDNRVEALPQVADGDLVEPGRALMRIEGPAHAILAAERVALNFLQRLCGVATLTHRYVEAVEGTGVEIRDTRKTLPGWRELDKYAVRCGGGKNHRFRLDDGILIKDNHLAVCGSIAEAVAAARREAPALLKIEVECDTLKQVKEALEARADVILLDNMTPEQIREAVELAGGRAYIEASGGVSLESVHDIAECGVHYISIGALTHSAPAADLSLDVETIH